MMLVQFSSTVWIFIRSSLLTRLLCYVIVVFKFIFCKSVNIKLQVIIQSWKKKMNLNDGMILGNLNVFFEISIKKYVRWITKMVFYIEVFFNAYISQINLWIFSWNIVLNQCFTFRYMPSYMYPYKVYPYYLSGVGYLMSLQVALKLYEEAFSIPIIHMEDVYITGTCLLITLLVANYRSQWCFVNVLDSRIILIG